MVRILLAQRKDTQPNVTSGRLLGGMKIQLSVEKQRVATGIILLSEDYC